MKRLLLLLCAVMISALVYSQTNYYSAAIGELTDLATWGTNTDGSGSNPTNFTTNNTRYHIYNRATATISAPWAVTGTTSRIIVGDGITPCEFTIPAAFAITGTGARMYVPANSTLTIQNATNPQMISLDVASTVKYDMTGAQTIAAGNYGNLLIQNDRGGAALTFAAGTVGVAGTFTFPTGIGSYVMTGNTLHYNKSGGGQVIYSHIPYNNLSSGATSGTNTTDGNLNVAGTLAIASSTSLDMGVNELTTATTLSFGNASSTLLTQKLTSAIPAGMAITGTGIINYNAAAGGQTIVPLAAYARLTLGNTGGTNTPGGNLVVNTALITTAGGTLDMGSNTLGGTLTTITNNGTILTQNASSAPFTTGKTWGGSGTVEYNHTGAQTVVAGTYNCALTISGARAGGNITFESGTVAVGGLLSLTATGVGAYVTTGNTFNYSTAAGGRTVYSIIPYNNLTSGNTSNTNTADGNLSVAGTLTTTNGGTLSLSTFDLSGTPAAITNNGTIRTLSLSNPALPAGQSWTGTTGAVIFASLTGGQSIPLGDYKTLTCLNTSGTNTVVGTGTLNMTGVLTTSAAGGILDMGTNLLVSSSTITNTGRIQTQNTTSLPLPSGKTWAGTVEYNGAGSQTMVAGSFANLVLSGDHGGGVLTLESGAINASGSFSVTATNIGSYTTAGNTFTYSGGTITVGGITYNNLTFSSGSNTKTADGNITVNGALTTTTGTGVLSMATFAIIDGGAMTVTNNGRISTASTNNPALPIGKNWEGTSGIVTFTALTGNQFIPSGTYKTLTCSNTSGTNTVVGGDLTMTGVLTATGGAGATLNLGTNALASSSTITNTGTIRTQSTSLTPLPTGKAWAGTVEYDGAGSQTMVAGTFVNMALSGDHGGGTLTLENNPINVSGNFSVTATNIGAYSPGTNVFTYSGVAASVGGITYNDLTFSSGAAGTRTANGNITVNGILTTTTGTGIFSMSTFALSGGGGMTVVNNGRISTASTNNPALPSGKNWEGTTGLVTFANTAGGQFVPAGTFKTLTFTNTSGTNTAVGNLTMTGVLTTSATGGTLDMGTNSLASSSTITNTGTIRTQNTTPSPLPSGLTWLGTVNYDAPTVDQTIVVGTYTNLTIGKTSGAGTAAGALTVNTALNITNPAATLDMGTFALAGAHTVANSGTITTANMSATPFAGGKTWGGTGTVIYNVPTGGQTVMAGTYTNNLTVLNATGTNSVSGTITANATLTTTAGGILDFAVANHQLLGATIVPVNNGTIQTICSVAPAIPTGKNWGGTIRYTRATGGQTLPVGTFNNLIFDNTSGIVTMPAGTGVLQVDGSLTTTSGGTLAMLLNRMTGALTSVTNNGTITTTSIGNPAIPSGKDWTGTTGVVTFAANTGNQFIPAGTYKTLNCSNTVNTNTVNGNITVSTGFATTAGGIVDMGANLLSGAFTPTNLGMLLTQNTTADPITSGKTWGGIVNYNAATGNQKIQPNTFATLRLENTTGTTTAFGDLTVNAWLSIVNAGATLDMDEYAMAGTMSTITNNGTITTANTSATPFTTGRTWGGTGTVIYNVPTGGQTVMAGTYTNNLTVLNAAGTNSVSGTITANATLTTTAGGILDFAVANHQLLGATIVPVNNGTIQTICSVAPAIPTGKNWGGTIRYTRATGGQTLPVGTFNNLIFDNTSGIVTMPAGTGVLQVDGSLTTTSGGTLAMLLNQMTGALTSVTNNGTITTTSIGNPAIPSGKDWTGTTGQVTFAATTGNQFIPAGTYKTLVCSNTSNTNTVNGDIEVTTGLTTTGGANGILNMGTNLLTGAFTPTNTGRIQTQNTSSSSITSGKTWAGVVEYNGAGAQTLVTGTFTNLALTGARAGSPTITLENGNINVSGNFSVTATGVGNYATGTNVFTYTTNANNSVGGIDYNDLIFANTANTKTANGNINVNGALSVASNGTFAMSTFALGGAPSSVTLNGSLSTASTNNPPIPSGYTWTGTTGLVTFASTTGGQSIPAGTYKTLTCANATGTNSAVATFSVAGTFTTNGATGTLDMGLFDFAATTVTNPAGATIRTESPSATPIPSGKTIAGTMEYYAPTGGQTIVSGTFTRLTQSNTTGTNTASGNISVSAALTTGTGDPIFDMDINTLSGTLTSITGDGTIKTASSVAAPITAAKTWSQTIEYNRATGGQTIVSGTYNGGLTNSNTSGTNTIAAAATVNVNGTLTLNSGSVLADNNRTITLNGNIEGTGTHTNSASGAIAMIGAGATISGATLGDVTLNNAAGFSLTGDPTIEGTLTLTSGILDIDANNLILGTAATAIAGSPSASNMIAAAGTGEVRKRFSATGSFDFPIGDNGPNYTPVSLNISSGTAGGGAYAGVNVKNTIHPENSNTANFLNRYWTVNLSDFTTPVYSLTGTYVSGDVDGDESEIVTGRYSGALPWVKHNMVNAGLNTISATGISATSSDFTGITNYVPTVTVTPPTVTICSGDSVELEAAGIGDPVLTYSWEPATGLSATTGATVMASPTTGVTPSTIVYTVTITDGNGFTSTATSTVSVNPAPVLTGPGVICMANTATYTSDVPGGTWQSVDTFVAHVDLTTGLVTPTGTGSVNIIYTTPIGCQNYATITVNPAVANIASYGPDVYGVCFGDTVTLTNATPGGTWESSNPTVATIDVNTGHVEGLTVGIIGMTYKTSVACYNAIPFATKALPAATTGTMEVCEGSTTFLANASAGGTWTSSNPAIGSVFYANGAVTGTGVAGGTVTITYNWYNHCKAYNTVTVNPRPDAITGTPTVCANFTSALSSAPGGGTWSSTHTAVATIGSASGVMSGVTGGLTTISYTLPTGCRRMVNVTVNNPPAAITAGSLGFLICPAGTTTLSSTSAGHIWSSEDLDIATVSSGGVVTGVAPGTVNIVYTHSVTGCPRSAVVTVTTLPAAITGPLTVCMGSNAALANATPGGTWASSDWTNATINMSTGIVNPVSTGTSNITYKIAGNGCHSVSEVTVNAAIASITGTTTVCVGQTTTLSNVSGGGVWSSSNTGVGTIDAGSGIVTAIGTGTTTISYIVSAGCYKTATVTVNNPPVAITGVFDVCVGTSTTLSNATPGGTWSSSNSGQANIGLGTGLVNGVSMGNPTITYRTGGAGCFVTQQITVNAAMAAIGGTASVCEGSNTTLTHAVGGGTWTSSNLAIGTVGSATGVVTGIASGTVRITYTIPNGCFQQKIVTVNAIPAVSGTAVVCAGATTALSSTLGGGAWTSSNIAVGTVNSTTGVTTGLTAGTTIITHTVAGCPGTLEVTVNLTPANITGILATCIGGTTELDNVTGGGTWMSSDGGVALVGSNDGIVTGIGTGTSLISYTLASGCQTTAVVTVDNVPAAITGTLSVCAGSTTALASATPGGVWSSANGAIATISVGGVVSAVAPGTSVISYIYSPTCYQTAVVTVDAAAAANTGTSVVCIGLTTDLDNATGGGTWSSGNVARATVGSATGIVTGVGAGTVNITYSIGTSCYSITEVTVNTTIASITGTTSVCAGSATDLDNADGGGIWSSSNPANATVDAGTGVVQGISSGTAIITYSISEGCFRTTTVNVLALPGSISGTAVVCEGATTVVSNGSGGGTWTSGDVGVATVYYASGLVTGVSEGTALITYNWYNGCKVSREVTVNPLPSVIAGTTTLCAGSTSLLTSAPGTGTWSSGSMSVATIGTGTGLVSAVASGLSTISYTLPTGCRRTTSVSVSVLPPAISGTRLLCPGGTSSLTAAGGHVWSSGDNDIATVSGGGLVTGIAPGTVNIIYTHSTNGCTRSVEVTVTTLPAAITGPTTICIGSAGNTLACATGGGTWSSSNWSKVTINSGTGVLTPVSAGTSNITYTIAGNGCYSSATVTVNAALAAITGVKTVCIGATTTLNHAVGGGTWVSSDILKGTVGSATGIVAGIDPGTTTITYSTAAGCFTSTNVTVSALPAAITGEATVCVGTSTALANATGGGTWSSSNTGQATIGSANGIANGLSAGMPEITYTVNGAGCYSTRQLTVNAALAAIGGTASVCIGSATTLTHAVGGGTWTSGNIARATVGSSSGEVTGVASGTVVISYTVPDGCYQQIVVTVNANPVISGTASVCEGAATTLSSTISGGAWTSSTPAVGTINSASRIVSGIAAGTTTITHTSAAGCVGEYEVTVNPLPASITGTGSTCIGGTTTLANVTGGGSWTSSNGAVATIGTGSGIVTGAGTGTTTISYSLATGCRRTTVVTVANVPTAVTGTLEICLGSTSALASTPSGGTWLSTNTAVATVGSSSGIVTSLMAGNTTISYTYSDNCVSTAIVTVNPALTSNTGTALVCAGQTVALSNATGGGTWSSSNTAKATINVSTGLVTGVSAGTTNITYRTTPSCFSVTEVTVNAAVAANTGTASVCIGSTTDLDNADGGGAWSSSNPARATVDAGTGVVTGISTGTVIITYTLSAGCYKTTTVNVLPLPAAIGGTAMICEGSTATVVTNGSAGGTWTSANPSIATVYYANGSVTGVADGTVLITYNWYNGCKVTRELTVNPRPSVIAGTPVVCAGSNTTLTSAPGTGTWTASHVTVATVGSGTGIVTGVNSGYTTISYTLPTGCRRMQAVTVNVRPTAITGTLTVCPGGTSDLNASSGSTWTTADGDIATVHSGTGLVTGVGAGTVDITFSHANGCYRIANVTVNALPDAITGANALCIAATTTYTNTSGGGTWSSSHPARATINSSSGLATGVAAGTATISYKTTGNGCFSTKLITVNPLPANISGAATVAVGGSVTFTNGTGGGTWSSANAGIATVGTSGSVGGVTPGATTISYILSATGCYKTKAITVTASRPGSTISESTETTGSFACYPNPTSGSFTFDVATTGKLAIYTLDGRMVQEYAITRPEMALSLPYDLAAGIYICNFKGDDGSTKTVRLVYNP